MRIWNYFCDNIIDHMEQIKTRGEPPTYSWLELILEVPGIFLLCVAPKSVYVLLSIVAVILTTMPLWIYTPIIIILRMPSNKGIGSPKSNFWYSKIKIKQRRIF